MLLTTEWLGLLNNNVSQKHMEGEWSHAEWIHKGLSYRFKTLKSKASDLSALSAFGTILTILSICINIEC